MTKYDKSLLQNESDLLLQSSTVLQYASIKKVTKKRTTHSNPQKPKSTHKGTVHNNPRQSTIIQKISTRIHNDPQRHTTTHSKSTTNHNDRNRSKKIHTDPQRL